MTRKKIDRGPELPVQDLIKKFDMERQSKIANSTKVEVNPYDAIPETTVEDAVPEVIIKEEVEINASSNPYDSIVESVKNPYDEDAIKEDSEKPNIIPELNATFEENPLEDTVRRIEEQEKEKQEPKKRPLEFLQRRIM